MTQALSTIYGIGGLAALLIVGAMHARVMLRHRAALRKALSYCRRDADGNLYVMDPQKGTMHRLDDLMLKRALGPAPDRTPRQQKKVRRRVRQALGAR
jgi:hypothetical protein